jgi:hypothetical protein
LLVFYLFFAVVSESRGRGAASPPAASVSRSGGTNETVSATKDDDHDHDHQEQEAAGARANSPVTNYVQALWLHWMMLGVVTAMVLFGSVVFAAPSSNATINFVVILGILFVAGHLHKLALGMAEPLQTIVTTLYFVIPHLEWYDIRDLIINERPPVAWIACGGATLYAAIYVLIFLVSGWLAFRRKMLSV